MWAQVMCRLQDIQFHGVRQPCRPILRYDAYEMYKCCEYRYKREKAFCKSTHVDRSMTLGNEFVVAPIVDTSSSFAVGNNRDGATVEEHGDTVENNEI